MILFKHLLLQKAPHRVAIPRFDQSPQIRSILYLQSNLHFYRYNKRLIRMASTLPKNAFFQALLDHDAHRIAVTQTATHREYTYGQLVKDVAHGRAWLDRKTEKMQLKSECIAFLAENGYEYVVTLLSIIASGAIAVPLAPAFPVNELKYVVEHSEAKVLLASGKNWDKAEQLVSSSEADNLVSLRLEELLCNGQGDFEVHLEDAHASEGMMLYTSGTTSKPKGVLLPINTLLAQSQSLIEAWRYSAHDLILNVLPLHHIHGTVNALLTPLLAGSTIEFLYPFNAESVWKRLAAPYLDDKSSGKAPNITFFSAVPTIYSRLLQHFSKMPEKIQAAAGKAIRPENLRLNISGSAALPVPVKSAWAKISNGNVLLERYGMTEVGMALSCGLDFKDRVDGSVGWPLPGVKARLVDTDTNMIIPVDDELGRDGKPRQGEIQLQGPTVFTRYWRNPDATAKEFTEDEVESPGTSDRWFKTGDIAIRSTVEGAGASDQAWARGPMYFIQGRQSADIIKTGGEKVSALEIEREMLSLPEIDECAVVGLSSEAWGQKVAAVVVLSNEEKAGRESRKGKSWSAMDMRRALRNRLAAYKIPQEMKVLDAIPRNAMGKVNKKELARDVYGECS